MKKELFMTIFRELDATANPENGKWREAVLNPGHLPTPLSQEHNRMQEKMLYYGSRQADCPYTNPLPLL